MNRLYADAETTGLNPHTDKMYTFQYCSDADPTPRIITRAYERRGEIIELINAHDALVGHNIGFDLGFLGYIPREFEDTFYLSKLAHFHCDGHSLDVVCERVLGYNPYEPYDKNKMQRSDWSGELTDDQIAYAKLDVEVLPRLLEEFEDYLDHPVYKFDKLSVISGLVIQRHGLPIDRSRISQDLGGFRATRDKVIGRLPFNPNSPKQVKKALNVDSTGDKVLAQLIDQGCSLAADVRLARRVLKHINFLEKLSGGERFYGTLKPSARSGRFTSDEENIQNLPRACKKYLAAKDGYVIISADFAALELRTIAALTGDPVMVDLLVSGADLHGYTAEQMYGADYTKDQRYIAKTFNFSLLYGAGAGTVQSMLLAQTGIWLDVEEVAVRRNQWLKTYSGIAKWQRSGKNAFNQGFCGKTPMGRPYKANMYTDHLSIINQGAGAEVARIALHKMLDLPLINFVHDCYIVECVNDPEVYEPIAKCIHNAMVEAWVEAPFSKRGIPMPVDVGVAQNWKDADALENCYYVYSGE